MNDAQKVQYIIEILKTGKGGQEAIDEFKKVEEANKKTGISFLELKSAVGSALAAFGALEFVRECIREAERAEDVNTRLTVALRNQVGASAASRDEMEELAEAMAKVTTASSGTVKAIAAQLITYGATAKQVKELVPLILDLSAATGESAEGFTAAFGGALNGQFGGLQRLLKIGFDSNKSDAENLALAIDVMRERYAGFAQTVANTPTGQIKQIKKEFADLKEELGTLALQAGGPFLGLLKDVTHWLNEIAKTRAFEAALRLGIGDNMSALTLLMSPKPASASPLPGLGGGPFNGIGGGAVRQTQEQIQANKELDGLILKLNADTLRGDEQKQRNAELQHQADIQEITDLGTKGKKTAEQIDAAKSVADEKLRISLADITSAHAIEDLENQITLHAKKSSEERSAQIQKEFELRTALYQRLAAVIKPAEGDPNGAGVPGNLTPSQLAELMKRARQSRAEDFASQSAGMNSERESLTLTEDQLYEAQMQRRIAAVKAYYDGVIQMAREANQETDQLEEEKTKHLEALMKQQTATSKRLYDGLKQIETQFVHGTASSFTTMLGEIEDRSKSAKQAWEDFGRSFLKMIRDMITQLLIELALQYAINAAKTFFLGSGGTVSGGSGDPGGEAKLANGGLRMAADGVDGVGEVTSPTLFPKWNTIAGEAGRELFTVLSKPHRIPGGVEGMAQGHRLVIMPAENVSERLRAANGYLTAGSSGFGASGVSASASGPDFTHIKIELSPELQARIITEAVHRSKVEVIRDVGRDTPMRKAVSSVGR